MATKPTPSVDAAPHDLDVDLGMDPSGICRKPKDAAIESSEGRQAPRPAQYELDLREIALDYACRLSPPKNSGAGLVQEAEAILKFLRGEG